MKPTSAEIDACTFDLLVFRKGSGYGSSIHRDSPAQSGNRNDALHPATPDCAAHGAGELEIILPDIIRDERRRHDQEQAFCAFESAHEDALVIARTRYDLHLGADLRGEPGRVSRNDTNSLVRGKKVRDDLRSDMPRRSSDDNHFLSLRFQAGK